MGPTIMLPSDKPGLRRWALERRAGLDMAALSEVLVAGLRDLPAFQSARDVLLDLALPGEVNVEALVADGSKRWYAPRCAPQRRLAIHPFAPGETPLRLGPFGIREPDAVRTPEADPAAIDLVIVPSLLLAPTGQRLGYGGGYYDRLLPRLRPDCVRVSALPDALLVPHLPKEPWDADMDYVVTETGRFAGDRQ
jgi:5-formyltetrahydrofolate cyclo-ligase